MLDPELKHTIQRLLASSASFAVVRLPGESPRLLTGEFESVFSVTPWPGSTPSAIIPPETKREAYIVQLKELISRLKKRQNSKTVLSRIISPGVKDVDWPSVAGELWDKFADTFGYFFFSKTTGGWIGASPEILLAVTPSGHFTTHALAGTIKVDEAWDEKNLEEHQIVADYIADILHKECLNFSKNQVRSLDYGEIKHLDTVFEGEFADNYDSGHLLTALAPTPALAGFPKQEAFADIADLEEHPRECYGGYMTYKTDKGSFSFVTIRCVHFNPSTNEAAIYVGGGITAQSDPLKEERETFLKARPILEIIKSNSVNKD